MGEELKRQEHVLDAVTDHTDRTNFDIQHVASQARKDFKVRPKRERSPHCGFHNGMSHLFPNRLGLPVVPEVTPALHLCNVVLQLVRLE